MGSAPSAVAYDSGKSEVFVANYNSSSVSVIADNNNTVVANITVGTQPCALAYRFLQKRGIRGPCRHQQVFSNIRRYKRHRCKHNCGKSTLKLSLRFRDGENLVPATTPVRSRSFLTARTRLSQPFEVGPSPNGVAYDSGNGRIFVSNYNSTSLSVVADSNNTVIANVPLQKQPQGMAFNSGKNELFVTYSESNKVSVIGDSAALPKEQTLPEFSILALILLVTAVAFVLVNLVHMKSKRRANPSRFP